MMLLDAQRFILLLYNTLKGNYLKEEEYGNAIYRR